MEDEARLARIAAAAAKITDLPVYDQIQALVPEGLTVMDMGYEQVNDPKGERLQQYVTIIPVRREG